MGWLRAGSAPLDHKDSSALLDRGAIHERRSYWLCSAARPPLTPQKKRCYWAQKETKLWLDR